MLFHNLDAIDQSIAHTLDPNCKGFADLDDLLELVQDKLQDPYLTLIKNYIQVGLEYKNSDKVFYSPLFGALPPFLKYAKRFDSFGIIERFNKELLSMDTHGQGFVSINLFKSVLEHELKIKDKIVVDFMVNVRETDQSSQVQSLDVNLFSHSLRSHIDYTTLLRKLAYYFDIREMSPSLAESYRATMPATQTEEVVLKIDIESAMRLRNPSSDLDPPNAFVSLNLPYPGCQPQQLKT